MASLPVTTWWCDDVNWLLTLDRAKYGDTTKNRVSVLSDGTFDPSGLPYNVVPLCLRVVDSISDHPRIPLKRLLKNRFLLLVWPITILTTVFDLSSDSVSKKIGSRFPVSFCYCLIHHSIMPGKRKSKSKKAKDKTKPKPCPINWMRARCWGCSR